MFKIPLGKRSKPAIILRVVSYLSNVNPTINAAVFSDPNSFFGRLPFMEVH